MDSLWNAYVTWQEHTVLITIHNKRILKKYTPDLSSWAAIHPGASQKIACTTQLMSISPRGKNFTPSQHKRVEFTPGQILIQFFSCKHYKDFVHTQGWVQPGVKFTPRKKLSCKHTLWLKKTLKGLKEDLQWISDTGADVHRCSFEQLFWKIS